MPTSEFFIYAADALPFDPGTGTFTLVNDYDFTTDRVLVTVNDDDQFMDGDEQADEFGEDANQTGTAATPDGTTLAQGNIYAEAFATIEAPDGTLIWIDRIEIEGEHIGYSPSQNLEPGVAYSFLSEVDIDNAPGGDFSSDNRLTYSEYEAQSVPCFVSGTMLLTRDGMMPVDWITVGDDLWTQDHGWQTVRWRGVRQFEDDPDFACPIEFAPGSLGTNTPAEVLRVSPQHRIRVSGSMCELWFGEVEVLVAAKHLVGRAGVSEVTLDKDHAYHHLLFDRHEVLTSDGIALESLFLGDQSPHLHPAPPLAMTHTLAEGHAQAARRCLTASEARILQESVFSPALILPEEAPDHAATGTVSAAIA